MAHLETLVDLPDTAVPITVVEVVCFIDGEGDTAYIVRTEGTESTMQVLGLLEIAKHHVMANSTFDEGDGE